MEEEVKKKICNKCNIEQEISQFPLRKDTNNYRNECKTCKYAYETKWREENSERVKELSKKWTKNNPEKVKESRQKTYQKTKIKRSEEAKERYKIKKHTIKEKHEKRYEENKELYKLITEKKCTKCDINKSIINFNVSKTKIDGYHCWCKSCVSEYDKSHPRQRDVDKRNKRIRERKNNEPIFNLNIKIRSLINKVFKRKGFTKKSKTQQILGCTWKEFKIHIESKFEPWMTWENRGKYNGTLNYGWDLDHIIPIDSAKTEEDVIKLNHYTNFQPLCSYTNRYIKRNKI